MAFLDSFLQTSHKGKSKSEYFLLKSIYQLKNNRVWGNCSLSLMEDPGDVNRILRDNSGREKSGIKKDFFRKDTKFLILMMYEYRLQHNYCFYTSNKLQQFTYKNPKPSPFKSSPPIIGQLVASCPNCPQQGTEQRLLFL